MTMFCFCLNLSIGVAIINLGDRVWWLGLLNVAVAFVFGFIWVLEDDYRWRAKMDRSNDRCDLHRATHDIADVFSRRRK